MGGEPKDHKKKKKEAAEEDLMVQLCYSSNTQTLSAA